jgi:lipopolysaccharide transport protein LptA
MFTKNKLIAVIVAGVAVGGIGICANDGAVSTTNRTVVTSDTLMFDYGRSTCIFEKNVVIDDPRVKMECEKLYVFFDKTNSVESIVATDSVKVWQDNKRGVCDKAVYTAKTGAIVMSGNAQLQRGNDLIKGDEIKIFVNSEKVICTPGRLVVFPDEIKKDQAKRKKPRH